jgi:hypothetical protein
MEELDKLVEKIDINSQRIDNNFKRIESNSQKILKNIIQIENNSNKIQQNSYALEILKDYKRANKRLYITLTIMMIMWIVTLFIFHF